MQIAEEDLLPPIFKERVEMLIGKDMYNTLDKFNDVEKELDAAKRAKYRSPKEPTVKELERRLEHLKARIMHHVTEKLTTKDHHIEKEEAKF